MNLDTTRRRIESLDIAVTPAPPRDIVAGFGWERTWERMLLDAAEHPQMRAAAAAYAEERTRQPYELSETFRLHVDRIRALLADVPKATKAAHSQARARFTEVEHVLAEAEAELARVNAERPLEISKIDRWASESATVDRRVQALTASHTQAAETLHDARTAVLAALQEVARQHVMALHRATDEAQQAQHRAQAAVRVAAQAEQDTQATYSRIKDWGLKDQHVAFVLKGDV